MGKTNCCVTLKVSTTNLSAPFQAAHKSPQVGPRAPNCYSRVVTVCLDGVVGVRARSKPASAWRAEALVGL